MRSNKYILLIILCAMLIICCGCDACKTPNAEVAVPDTDARYIPPDMKEKLQTEFEAYEGSHYFLRVYDSVLLYSMCDYDSISAWLADHEHKVAYMAVTGDENDYECGCLITEKGGTLEQSRISTYYYHSWNILLPYVINPELIFGAEAEIYAVYCITGGSVFDGDTILYMTDQGNYVLHKYLPYLEEVYLVPVDVLRNMYTQLKKPSEGAGVWYAMDALPGIQEYIIDLENPPEFPLS